MTSDMFAALRAHYDNVKTRNIVDLFDEDRFDAFSLSACDLLIDYSKTNIDVEARQFLIDLASARSVAERRDAMLKGEKINETEDRAVLHTALRADEDASITVDGENVIPDIHAVLARMRAFSDAVRTGEIVASDGKAFTDVVNIGIGGSDLGPVMVNAALAPFHDGPRTHFISNVDGAHAADILRGLDPERTLVIVASKTFTTIETLTNARTVREWLGGVKDPMQHFAAISTALDKTAEFGIAEDRVFGFSDWVGGRYSLWGPIGLSIMLAVGADHFDALLAGARAMDAHFASANPVENGPMMMGLIGIWYRNICNYATRVVLPYDQRLLRLPAYLQQLDMESNGKSVTLAGEFTDYETGPIVWGEPGTNGQHAFYQLIHQGTSVIPCEFLVARRGFERDLKHHHNLLKANCLAQSEALMIGRDMDAAREIAREKGFSGDTLEAQAAQRVFKGNRPSVTIAYDQLTPNILGQIIALYEHRVFVEGVIWGINSFDQWGVELGKELANALLPIIEGRETPEKKDGSTKGLVSFLT